MGKAGKWVKRAYLDDAEQLLTLLRFPFPKLQVNILRLILGCCRLQLEVERHDSGSLRSGHGRFGLGILSLHAEVLQFTRKAMNPYSYIEIERRTQLAEKPILGIVKLCSHNPVGHPQGSQSFELVRGAPYPSRLPGG